MCIRDRVITDHIRSATFMICDGVLPSNEGRGYVLRRLLRRAARHGKLLGVDHPFLYEVCDTVIHENEGHYPELRERQDYIKMCIRDRHGRHLLFVAPIIPLHGQKFKRAAEQNLDLRPGVW